MTFEVDVHRRWGTARLFLDNAKIMPKENGCGTERRIHGSLMVDSRGRGGTDFARCVQMVVFGF